MNARSVAIRSVKADLSHLQVEGTCLKLGCGHLVWLCESCSPTGDAEIEGPGVPNLGRWVQAKNLLPGHRVFTIGGSRQVEGNTVRVGEAVSIAELEISELHNYAVGHYGILVHNRNPALVAGQAYQIGIQGTGVRGSFTLPPIDNDHIFRGFFQAGTQVRASRLVVQNHTVMTTNPAGAPIARAVNLRIIPGLTVSGDAPFSARIEYSSILGQTG